MIVKRAAVVFALPTPNGRNALSKSASREARTKFLKIPQRKQEAYPRR